MKDGSSRLMVLSDRLIQAPAALSRARVCGLCLSSMKATRAIRQKKSSGSPRSVEFLTQAGSTWTDRDGSQQALDA